MDQITITLTEGKLQDLLRGTTCVGTESLTGTILQQIKDLILSFLDKIRTMLSTTLFKGAGRTELSEYLRVNTVKVSAYLSQPMQSVPTRAIPIPQGMRHSYKDTATDLGAILLGQLDIGMVVALLKGTIDDVVRLNTHSDLATRGRLQENYYQAKSFLVSDSKVLSSMLEKDFDATSSLKTGMTTPAMRTHRDVRLTIDAVTNMTRIYPTAERYRRAIEDLFTRIDTVTRRINPSTTALTRDDLIVYAFVLTKTAHLMRLYGVALALVQQVEHRFVQALGVIVA